MSTLKRLLPGLFLAVLSTGCEPPKVEPELTLTAAPRTIDSVGQKTTIRAFATDDTGKPGTGNVRFSTPAGSLKAGEEVALLAGEAAVEFTCVNAMDSACTGVVRVTAEWVAAGKPVTATVNITVSPPPPVDAGTFTLNVTASPSTVDVGSGGSTITATYLVDNLPAADASVSIATSLGQIFSVDGGTYVPGTTDSAGQVRALVTDNGSAGVAQITANGPRSTMGTATVTFNMRDAGPPVDGGYSLSLSADKNQVIAGVGDATILTATLVSVSPTVGLPVSFSTTVGRLGPVNGSGIGTSYIANTDDAGVARAQLVAGSSDTGQAVVTASFDGGVTSNNVTVNIVNVSQISFVSTECPQTAMNCNLMGLQGSGFNETALLKFKVSDGTGAGVSGVNVSFALNGAPAGTSVDPAGVTNAMGEVRANVRSGRTIGTFTVTATALNMFSVTSPTIGVRGAKPSNNGFTLRCDRVNLPAYAAVTPPLPVSVTCQVGLSDRYGNPIGTGTQVRLNSEAGQVPNNVATTPYSPGVQNEGFGSFTFQTAMGRFPPVDVDPFAADPAQFPVPRALEPSVPGAIVRNPRDGMVTIIAYLQGEEHFADDNANGTRDSNEQFIDQGEPFVDANDNNVWDTGEIFVDTPPVDGGMPNNQWDGPNGTWDSTSQIWTEYRLLYTGPTASSNCLLTPNASRTGGGTYGILPLNGSYALNAFVGDANLNRIEGGSSVGVRFQPQTRGGIMLTNSNANLDGYGFGFQRMLVNAAGTGSCTPSELVCRWKVLFEGWNEGYVGVVALTGAGAPAMPTSQAAVIETTVRGIISGCSAGGTVE